MLSLKLFYCEEVGESQFSGLLQIDEARIEREVQANEKRIRKELEKQDILRRKV